MGLGFTGVRDLISFLLNADADSSGQPNPVRDNGAGIEKAYGWGCSQSARFLREFTYRGFNEDAEGRQVFAGISPFVSGGGRVFVQLPLLPARPVPEAALRPPLPLRPVPPRLLRHHRHNNRQV